MAKKITLTFTRDNLVCLQVALNAGIVHCLRYESEMRTRYLNPEPGDTPAMIEVERSMAETAVKVKKQHRKLLKKITAAIPHLP